MERHEFWKLIAESRHGAIDHPDLQLDQLQAALVLLSADEVLSFGTILFELHRESYRGELWGAAFIIGGGCSDDGFDYFRAWLIAQGEEIYKAALADPDTLAGQPLEEVPELEDLLSLPADVWEELTGREDFFEQLPSVKHRVIAREELAVWSDGKGGLDEAAAQAHYPRLYERFWK